MDKSSHAVKAESNMANSFLWGNTGEKWGSWHSNPGSLTPETQDLWLRGPHSLPGRGCAGNPPPGSDSAFQVWPLISWLWFFGTSNLHSKWRPCQRAGSGEGNKALGMIGVATAIQPGPKATAQISLTPMGVGNPHGQRLSLRPGFTLHGQKDKLCSSLGFPTKHDNYRLGEGIRSILCIFHCQ